MQNEKDIFATNDEGGSAEFANHLTVHLSVSGQSRDY